MTDLYKIMEDDDVPADLETKDETFDTGKDTIEIKKHLGEFMSAWEQFQAKNDERLAAMNSRLDKSGEDAITKDEFKKLNAAMDEHKAVVDKMRLELRRPVVTGSDGRKSALTDDQIEHASRFKTFLRKGATDGLDELQIKALSVGSDPDGGYAVPVEMEAGLDRVISEVSPIRQISTVRQVGSASYSRLVTTEGADAGWVGERDSRPETDSPRMSRLEFPVHELYANARATQSLLDDAVFDVEGYIRDEVQTKFAEMEGAGFVSGNGSSKPRGLLSYPFVANSSWSWGSVGYVATGASGAFASGAEGDDYDNLVDLVYSLKSSLRGNARHVMSRLTQGEVRKIKDADGNPTWRAGLDSGQPATLLGYPVTEAEDMPEIAADAHAIAFGDFRRGYLIVDRIGTRILRDPFSSKPHVEFYITKRVGGGIQHFDAFKTLKFGAS